MQSPGPENISGPGKGKPPGSYITPGSKRPPGLEETPSSQMTYGSRATSGFKTTSGSRETFGFETTSGSKRNLQVENNLRVQKEPPKRPLGPEKPLGSKRRPGPKETFGFKTISGPQDLKKNFWVPTLPPGPVTISGSKGEPPGSHMTSGSRYDLRIKRRTSGFPHDLRDLRVQKGYILKPPGLKKGFTLQPPGSKTRVHPASEFEDESPSSLWVPGQKSIQSLDPGKTCPGSWILQESKTQGYPSIACSLTLGGRLQYYIVESSQESMAEFN
ncbi:hypothetical protein DY000_02014384 [Brassica cretica]|uniref:Uncharacterized protein n=1 Tax=Brassica cretica TaxID=69181 RepID=A0ABQ7CWC7_BRACR|nr:hypothetical protein DY000_02014384 [Brassica cretica]